MKQLFDQNKFEEFEAAYNEAVKNNKTQFTFEGNEVLVTYGKYLLEYLSKSYE